MEFTILIQILKSGKVRTRDIIQTDKALQALQRLLRFFLSTADRHLPSTRHQHGFRKIRSTQNTHALNELFQDIQQRISFKINIHSFKQDVLQGGFCQHFFLIYTSQNSHNFSKK